MIIKIPGVAAFARLGKLLLVMKPRKEHGCMSRSLVEPLISNGYTLEMTPERLGWLEPTGADLPLEQLRGKDRRSGYPWAKGFFGAEDRQAFHRVFFCTLSLG